MTLSEQYAEFVKARKRGEACPCEHEWSPMDEIIVKSLIPEALCRVYWMTKRQRVSDAYVAAEEVKPRLQYAPFLWHVPSRIRVSRDVSVDTVEIVQMVETTDF